MPDRWALILAVTTSSIRSRILKDRIKSVNVTPAACHNIVDPFEDTERLVASGHWISFELGAVTPSYHGRITAFLHSKYVQKLPDRSNLIQKSRQKRS